MENLPAKNKSNKPETITETLFSFIEKELAKARVAAAIDVNCHVLLLNYRIGQQIVAQRQSKGWGAKVIPDLAARLKNKGYKGYGISNLKEMARFAEQYSENEIGQTRLANLGWEAHKALLKIEDRKTRLWYMDQAVQNSWSVRVLQSQLDSKLHLRQGKALSNYKETLPNPQGELAQELVKSDYNFEHLALNSTSKERDVEQQLVDKVCLMIQELGKGFAFVDRQYHFSEAEQDFFIDLLFYHTKLHAYVVVELKAENFKPEFAGKLSFYVSSIDDIERTEGDNPTIGILLCRGYNEVIVERSLRGQTKPVAVAAIRQLEEQIIKSLPKSLQSGLSDELLDN